MYRSCELSCLFFVKVVYLRERKKNNKINRYISVHCSHLTDRLSFVWILDERPTLKFSMLQSHVFVSITNYLFLPTLMPVVSARTISYILYIYTRFPISNGHSIVIKLMINRRDVPTKCVCVCVYLFTITLS